MARKVSGPTGGLRSGGAFRAGSMRTARIQGVKASLTTALAGANNDLKYTARSVGTAGNSITITYAVAGTNTPLSVAVAGTAITVNSATNGAGAATSTSQQVLNAVTGSNAAQALVDVEHAAGNDGTGVIAALASTPLAGGTGHNI